MERQKYIFRGFTKVSLMKTVRKLVKKATSAKLTSRCTPYAIRSKIK